MAPGACRIALASVTAGGRSIRRILRPAGRMSAAHLRWNTAFRPGPRRPLAFQSDREGDLPSPRRLQPGAGPGGRRSPNRARSHVPGPGLRKATLPASVTKGSDAVRRGRTLQLPEADAIRTFHRRPPTNARVLASTDRRRAALQHGRVPAMILSSRFRAGRRRSSAASSRPCTRSWSLTGRRICYKPAPGQIAWVSVTSTRCLPSGIQRRA